MLLGNVSLDVSWLECHPEGLPGDCQYCTELVRVLPSPPLCFLYMSYEFMTCHKQFRQQLDPTKLKCKTSLNEKSQDLCSQKGSLGWIRANGRSDLQDQAFINSSLNHLLLPFGFAWRTDTNFSNCSILILQFLLAIWKCCLINHWN